MLLTIFCIFPVNADTNKTQTLSQYYGFTYRDYLSYLKSHEQDTYYLTTPYVSGDYRSPNGDTSFNGTAAMNCSGFLWHVIKSCIENAGGNYEDFDIPCFSSRKNWMQILTDNNIEYYIYRSKQEALASGRLQQGDIIMMFTNENFKSDSLNHIGIYWGDGKTDVLWHSGFEENQISEITSMGDMCRIAVVKISNDTGSLTVKLSVRQTGYTFTLTDSDGILVDEKSTNLTGIATFLNLPYDTYTLYQSISTNEKYRISDTIKIDNSENIEIAIILPGHSSTLENTDTSANLAVLQTDKNMFTFLTDNGSISLQRQEQQWKDFK